eukprot:scaffold29372_cov25-Tisochrysis_lutea.AAC.2
MGHRALPNCAWSLGSNTGGAVGYLVGKPHEGLQVRRCTRGRIWRVIKIVTAVCGVRTPSMPDSLTVCAIVLPRHCGRLCS